MSETLSISTKAIRHEFLIDGVKYYLPGITMGDFETVAKLSEMPVRERIGAFRDLMASRVQRASRWAFWRKSGRLAVYALSPAEVTRIFKLWGVGLTPGESSASRAK